MITQQSLREGMSQNPMTNFPKLADAFSIKVNSPSGAVFVHCTEIEGQLKHVIINIGKAGSDIHTWADALSRMINLALETKDLLDILVDLSNITSAKISRSVNGIFVKSAPDAVFYALHLYRNMKMSGSIHNNNRRKRQYGFVKLK